MPQRQLRRRQWRRDLIDTRRLNIVPVPIDSQPQLPRLSVHDFSHSVRAAQRLMLLKPMPAVHRDPVIPPGPKLRQPTILRLKLQRRNLLEGVLLRVPLDADVVDGLLGEVLQHLRAERVGYFVGHVESAGLLRDDVDGIVVFNVVVGAGELFL